MRTDPNPGECHMGIHEVNLLFSSSLEMLGEIRLGHLLESGG